MRERKREGGHGGTPFNGSDCSASQMHNREDQSANGTIIASHWANYTLWAKSPHPLPPKITPLPPNSPHTHPSVKMVNKANKAQGRHGKAVNTQLLCLSPVRAPLSSPLLPSPFLYLCRSPGRMWTLFIWAIREEKWTLGIVYYPCSQQYTEIPERLRDLERSLDKY